MGMAVRIVLGVAKAGTLSRVLRGFAIGTGPLLMFVAIVLIAPFPIMFTVGSVLDAIDGRGLTAPWTWSPPPATPEDQGVGLDPFIRVVVIVVVGVWLGLLLIRGRRRFGLYLRKFG